MPYTIRPRGIHFCQNIWTLSRYSRDPVSSKHLMVLNFLAACHPRVYGFIRKSGIGVIFSRVWRTFCPVSEFVHKGAQLHIILRRKIPRWDFQAHYTDVFSLRWFDLSLGLGLSSPIQSHSPIISQHRSLTAIGLSLRLLRLLRLWGKLPLTYWFSHVKERRQKTDRTLGKSQIKLSLLRSIFFLIQPQAKQHRRRSQMRPRFIYQL